MADEVRQVFAIDASQALKALRDLDAASKTYDKTVRSLANSLDLFNKKAGSTVAALKRIADESGRAARNLGKVAIASKGVTGGGAGGGSPVSPAAMHGVDDYIAKIREMHQISANATTQTKRLFESSITATAEAAAKAKIPMSEFTNIGKNMGASYVGASNKVANGFARVSAAAKKHLTAAAHNAHALTITFSTMIRIITTQFIVRALSGIRKGFQESYDSAVKFNQALLEIRTISPEKNLNTLGAAVRRVSDAFGTDLQKTAESFYQTLSNQIASTTPDVEKFNIAMAKLAKVGVSDLDTATNLVTGTLNAYSMDARHAEEVSAQFFKTVELGRTRLTELSQSYGDVAAIAAQLGVSATELDAAFATLTISGINTAKASTQLRGILQSFIKPTQEMTAAMKGLGYETAEEFWRANDLAEGLKLITETTDGTAAAISKLFPRIRGLTGEMLLGSLQTEKFAENFKKINETSLGSFNEELERMMGTDFEKFQRELNKLRNFFTVEFGQAILEGLTSFVSFIGGMDDLIVILRSAIGPAAAFTAAMALVGAGLLATAAHAKLVALEMTKMAAGMSILFAAAAAWTTGKVIGNLIFDAWTSGSKEYIESLEKVVAVQKRISAEQLKIEKAKVDETLKHLSRAKAISNKAYMAIKDDIQVRQEQTLSMLKFYMAEKIKTHTRELNRLRAISAKAYKDIAADQERILDTQSQVEDKLFQSQTSRRYGADSGMDPDVAKRYEALAYQRKAEQLSSKGYALMKAGNEAGLEYFKRAESYMDQALSKTKEMANSRVSEQNVEQAMQSMANQKVSGLKKMQQLNKRKADEAEREGAAEQKTVGTLKTKQKTINESIKESMKTGDFSKSIQLMSDFFQGDNALVIKQIVPALEALPNFKRELQAAFDKNIGAYAVDIKAVVGHEVDAANYEDSMKEMYNRVAAYHEAVAIRSELRIQQVAASVKTEKAYEDFGTAPEAKYPSAKIFNMSVQDSRRLKDDVSTLFDDLKKAAEQPIDAKIFNDLQKRVVALEPYMRSKGKVLFTALLDGLKEKAKTGQELKDLVVPDIGKAVNTLKKRDPAYEAQIKADDARIKAEREARMNAIQSPNAGEQKAQEAIDRLKTSVDGVKTSATGVGTETGKIANATVPVKSALFALGGAYDALVGKANNVARATQNIVNIAKGGGTATAAHGRQIRYLADGGMARGTDTVPAMLSVGERVINAKAARKFATQLTAINARTQPIYRETGGTVTNIGDVSINVNESKNPQSTAREVMKQFRREQRRGSGRI